MKRAVTMTPNIKLQLFNFIVITEVAYESDTYDSRNKIDTQCTPAEVPKKNFKNHI